MVSNFRSVFEEINDYNIKLKEILNDYKTQSICCTICTTSDLNNFCLDCLFCCTTLRCLKCIQMVKCRQCKVAKYLCELAHSDLCRNCANENYDFGIDDDIDPVHREHLNSCRQWQCCYCEEIFMYG